MCLETFTTQDVVLALAAVTLVVPAVVLDEDLRAAIDEIASSEEASVAGDQIDIDLRFGKAMSDEDDAEHRFLG